MTDVQYRSSSTYGAAPVSSGSAGGFAVLLTVIAAFASAARWAAGSWAGAASMIVLISLVASASFVLSMTAPTGSRALRGIGGLTGLGILAFSLYPYLDAFVSTTMRIS